MAASGKTEDKALKTVQLEGHVVLKIIKHCREFMPALVTGQLLGLDVGQTLEVTDSFPFPVTICCRAGWASWTDPKQGCQCGGQA